MSDEIAIRTIALRKRFGRIHALRGLDLTVQRGQIFGFLGPNGAGKTTTIRILLDLLRPTAGRAYIWGTSVRSVAARAGGRVGALVEDPSFYEYLSGRRNLQLLAALSGPVDNERIDEALRLVGLAGRADDAYGTYSHGMKQRLGIAQALLPDPDLLILDEPAGGLDPKGLVEVRDLLQRLNRENGTTIFLSSHLLHEVELICTHAAIVNDGRIIEQGPVRDLLATADVAVRIAVDDIAAGLRILNGVDFVESVVEEGEDLVVVCLSDDIPDVNAALVNGGVGVYALHRAQLTLEDLYMKLMS